MKTLICLGALTLGMAATAAEPEIHAGQADCRIVHPAPQPDAKGTWSGACKDGYADGKGLLQWYVLDQAMGGYDGTLVRGRPHGEGEYYYADLRIYKGGFKDGRRSGKGMLSFNGGGTLSATFEDDQPVGTVERRYPGAKRGRGWRTAPLRDEIGRIQDRQPVQARDRPQP